MRQLPAVLTTLVIALLLGLPVLDAPATRALGRACSEAPAHLWGLWVTADGLFESGPFLRTAQVGFPGVFEQHLIDPIHLWVFAPVLGLVGGASGAVLAWNLVHLGAVLWGGLGCVLLGRRLALEPAAVAVLIAIFVGSSPVLHQAETGRSEYLVILGLPLALAAMHRWLQDGRGLGWAGLTVGLLGWGGPVAGIFCLPLLAWVGWRWGRDAAVRTRLQRLAAVALIGALVALPPFLAVLQWPTLASAGVLAGGAREASTSVDIGSLVRLGDTGVGILTTPYPGLLACLLALGGGRRGWPWALLGAALLIVCLGPRPSIGGTLWRGPAELFTILFPPLERISGWPRLCYAAVLPIGIAAALGVGRLGKWAALLVPLLLWDQATHPRPLGDRSFAAAMDPKLAALVQTLPPGALWTMPSLRAGDQQTCALDTVHLLHAQQHGRPVSSNLGMPQDGLVHSSWLSQTLLIRARRARQFGQDPALRDCAQADLVALGGQGLGALLIHSTLPGGEVSAAGAKALLGAPDHEAGGVLAWVVPGPDGFATPTGGATSGCPSLQDRGP